MCLFLLCFIKIRLEVILPVYVLRTYFCVYRYACVIARSLVNIEHLIGCLVVFSWYDVITFEK